MVPRPAGAHRHPSRRWIGELIGAVKQTDARKEANADKLDADYKVAIEKCDALAGAAKDSCVSAAKAQFAKS